METASEDTVHDDLPLREERRIRQKVKCHCHIIGLNVEYLLSPIQVHTVLTLSS